MMEIGPNCDFDLLQPGDASLIIANVPFENRNAGFGLKLVGRFVIAAVVRSDLIAPVFQLNRNGVTDTARAACYNRNLAHNPSQKTLLVVSIVACF